MDGAAKLKMEDYELTTNRMRQRIKQGIEECIQIGEVKGIVWGRHSEALRLVTRLLWRRFGGPFMSYEKQLENLTLAQLEDLAEALLDFAGAGDLAQWLARQS